MPANGMPTPSPMEARAPLRKLSVKPRRPPVLGAEASDPAPANAKKRPPTSTPGMLVGNHRGAEIATTLFSMASPPRESTSCCLGFSGSRSRQTPIGPRPLCLKPLKMKAEPEAPPRWKRSCKQVGRPSSGSNKPQAAAACNARPCGNLEVTPACVSLRKKLTSPSPPASSVSHRTCASSALAALKPQEPEWATEVLTDRNRALCTSTEGKRAPPTAGVKSRKAASSNTLCEPVAFENFIKPCTTLSL
mmetsp:Transcript_103602/g.333895  ORF Transcript_103602/g.333895 Transcript_103602/m.333895 type:complete len:248 (+) Transcript_103602:713-1456(+)